MIRIKAPIVEGNGQIDNDAYLLLSYLQEGGRGDQRDLAKLVAKMHSQQQPDGKFGFEMPHEGGDISFDNSWCDTWQELFVERRLEPLKEALVDKGPCPRVPLSTALNVFQRIVLAMYRTNYYQTKYRHLHGAFQIQIYHQVVVGYAF